MSELNHRIDAILKVAFNDTDRRFGDDHCYANFDLDDPEVRKALVPIAMFRDLTLDDLDVVLIAQDEAIKLNIAKVGAFLADCHQQRDDLKIYFIHNTNGKVLKVLAKDRACALWFAKSHGHIHEEKNGRVLVMKEERQAALRVSGEALGRALRDGKPGAVTEHGNTVIMSNPDRVYQPMTIVT